MGKEKTVQVPVSILADLFARHDEWSGSLHPDDRDGYLSKYPDVRKRLEKKLRENNLLEGNNHE